MVVCHSASFANYTVCKATALGEMSQEASVFDLSQDCPKGALKECGLVPTVQVLPSLRFWSLFPEVVRA